jgi:hypothetical protein
VAQPEEGRMTFDPGDSFFNRNRLPESAMMVRALTSVIFDSFVRGIVREHYHPSPAHVTLQVDRDDTMLYVRGHEGTSFIAEDDGLREWAIDFIAGDVFSLDADQVDVIYLDGAVGSDDAYLHISGKGILISSGEPRQKGTYL